MKKVHVLIVSIFMCVALTGCCFRHDWKDATCEEPKTCAKCGKTVGEPLGHTWVDPTCESPKTCSVCGKTEGEALGHTWIEATCEAPKTCSVCGKTEGELGHKWVSATCDKPKTCSKCGATEGKALGHDWEDATCQAPKTCKRCGLTQGEIGKHSFSNGKCSVCGINQVIVLNGRDLGVADQYFNVTYYFETNKYYDEFEHKLKNVDGFTTLCYTIELKDDYEISDVTSTAIKVLISPPEGGEFTKDVPGSRRWEVGDRSFTGYICEPPGYEFKEFNTGRLLYVWYGNGEIKYRQ